jgi:indole-3-glycerol phosphate synthase
MNYLEKIAAAKRKEVDAFKREISLRELEKSRFFRSPVPSLYDALLKAKPAIIAEFKRKSPSKGDIQESAEVSRIVPAYVKAGAAALSVLTDMHFDGSNMDLVIASSLTGIPLLRKDFILDEYQVVEAKSMGASAILLIAALLDANEIKNLSSLANRLGMEVLFEVHEPAEMDKLSEGIRIVGVNNRNLKTFRIDMEQSFRLRPLIPPECLAVSESGIDNPNTAAKLFNAGFSGFLMGEYFMKQPDPGACLEGFIKDLKGMIS